MAQRCLKLVRPWTTSVRFLTTSALRRKEVTVQVASEEDKEKNVCSSTGAAGEDYFSGLINTLQGNHCEHNPAEDTKSPARAVNYSLRSVTQHLMAEQRASEDSSPSDAAMSEKECSNGSSTPLKDDLEADVENVRMTLAGVTEEPPSFRATFASLPPSVIPFPQNLHLVQKPTETRTDDDVHIKAIKETHFSAERNLTYAHAKVKDSSDKNADGYGKILSSGKPERIRVSFTRENENIPDYKLTTVPLTSVPPNENKNLDVAVDQKLPQQMADALHISPEKQSVAIDDVAPAITPSFNLAAYVPRSEALQQLVKLGVDLSLWETHEGIPEYILRLNFERDMKEKIQFLHDLGIAAEDLGIVLTKNPFIFKQSLENLQIRINYLQSKRFTKDAIVRIVVTAPRFLNVSTKDVDERLGYLQKLFKLTGDEVRFAIARLPKLVTWKFVSIQQMQFTMLEEFGFSPEELKTIFLTKPKIWLASRYAIQERFDYLHTTMGISHQLLTLFPGALLCRTFIFKQRHLYLKHIGRVQYDPKKPNYVSLKALVTGTDSVFCREVAKTPVHQFNDFLKTL